MILEPIRLPATEGQVHQLKSIRRRGFGLGYLGYLMFRVEIRRITGRDTALEDIDCEDARIVLREIRGRGGWWARSCSSRN